MKIIMSQTTLNLKILKTGLIFIKWDLILLISTRGVKWHANEWQMVLYLGLVLACWFTCVVLLDRRRFLIARELPNPASVCQQGVQNSYNTRPAAD